MKEYLKFFVQKTKLFIIPIAIMVLLQTVLIVSGSKTALCDDYGIGVDSYSEPPDYHCEP